MNTDSNTTPSSVEQRTQRVFNDSVEQLDGRTRSKLTQARFAALDELRQQRARPWRRAWLPLSGAVAASVLAVWVTMSPVGPDVLNNGSAREVPLDELDLVAGQASIDLLEDVEFYAWVAQQSPGRSSGYL